MPVVPFSPQPPKGRSLPTDVPAAQEPWVLMAAAQMDAQGRLVEVDAPEEETPTDG